MSPIRTDRAREVLVDEMHLRETYQELYLNMMVPYLDNLSGESTFEINQL